MFRSINQSKQITSYINFLAKRTFSTEAAAIDPEKFKDPGFQRKFLDGIQKELKFNSYEGWYQVKPEEITKRGGEPLMKLYGNNFIKTVTSVYNDIPFQSAKFYNNMSLDFWRNIDNVRQFFDNVASKLGTSGMWENWYQTSTDTIENFGGKGLLEVYKGMVNALLQAYPEHPWKIWKFNNLPKDYWIEKKRQREFMDDMIKAYGYKNFEDYYKLTSMHLIKHGGRGLLHLYNDKVHDVVMCVYPENDWKIWRFMRVFDDWWDKLPNQRFFMRDLQKHLGFNSMEDWYKLKSKDITEYGGKRLLYMHNNSLAKVLQVIYPDYNWQIYRFTRVPKNHWDKDEDLEKLFKEAGSKMGISQHEEWVKVSEEDLESLNIPGSGPLIYKYGGIINMAEAVNNKVQWRELELRNESDTVKTHRNVARYIKKLFPTVTDVQMNYTVPELKLPLSGMQLTYGVYVPQLKLAFHWQGERLSFFTGKKPFRQEVSEKLGIKLVYVSTNWDKSIEQLEDYIREQHPDLNIEKPTGDRMARKKALRKMMEGDEKKKEAAPAKPATPKVEEKEEERPVPAWLANYLKQQQEEKEKKELEEKLKEEKANSAQQSSSN